MRQTTLRSVGTIGLVIVAALTLPRIAAADVAPPAPSPPGRLPLLEGRLGLVLGTTTVAAPERATGAMVFAGGHACLLGMGLTGRNRTGLRAGEYLGIDAGGGGATNGLWGGGRIDLGVQAYYGIDERYELGLRLYLHATALGKLRDVRDQDDAYVARFLGRLGPYAVDVGVDVGGGTGLTYLGAGARRIFTRPGADWFAALEYEHYAFDSGGASEWLAAWVGAQY